MLFWTSKIQLYYGCFLKLQKATPTFYSSLSYISSYISLSVVQILISCAVHFNHILLSTATNIGQWLSRWLCINWAHLNIQLNWIESCDMWPKACDNKMVDIILWCDQRVWGHSLLEYSSYQHHWPKMNYRILGGLFCLCVALLCVQRTDAVSTITFRGCFFRF